MSRRPRVAICTPVCKELCRPCPVALCKSSVFNAHRQITHLVQDLNRTPLRVDAQLRPWNHIRKITFPYVASSSPSLHSSELNRSTRRYTNDLLTVLCKRTSFVTEQILYPPELFGKRACSYDRVGYLVVIHDMMRIDRLAHIQVDAQTRR